jgi:hypothetical protein
VDIYHGDGGLVNLIKLEATLDTVTFTFYSDAGPEFSIVKNGINSNADYSGTVYNGNDITMCKWR